MKRIILLFVAFIIPLFILAVIIGIDNNIAGQGSSSGIGNLKVKLFDHNGVPINGQITAAKGGIIKTCSTSAGSCTMYNIPTGTWVATAKIGSKKSEPKYKNIQSGQTSTLTLQIITIGLEDYEESAPDFDCSLCECPVCPPPVACVDADITTGTQAVPTVGR